MQINWDSFKTYNQDAQGVHYKFENLCRQLFANENLTTNKQYKYLHANPNNYGLETEPIFDETRQLWIGFQAKFFDGDVNYTKIKESAQKIVKYYTGQAGKVDLVFLFCNKPIKSTAKTYIDTVNLLIENNIELQLITDTAILDLVINKYQYLGLYYFGNNTISPNWFVTHASQMFDYLGERYNREFNVETTSLDELSLFVHDQRAADYLNEKKKRILGEIENLYWGQDYYRAYLSTLRDAVVALPNVDTETLMEACSWLQTVKERVKEHLDDFRTSLDDLRSRQDEAYDIIHKSQTEEEDRKAAIELVRNVGQKISKLTILINLPEMLSVSEREHQLLSGQILKLYGGAGAGKSQLLAFKANSLLEVGRSTLLLAAGIYYSNEPIQEQISKNLRLEFDFESLIDILETIGERNNYIVPIFIDALNETWNNKLWKTGLLQIADKIKRSPMVRLVISYRSEYEKIVVPDSMDGEDVVSMFHHGFEDNSIEAAREFLDHYNIPFTPLEYFGFEMSNPLFLTLYCKTYDGQEVSLSTLYERYIEKINSSIFHALEEELKTKGYVDNSQLLQPLVEQISEQLVKKEERSISKADLIKLSYWTEYGITPGSFIGHLVKENFLHNSTFEDVERYYFAFDQMNDYYCAKAIVKSNNSKDKVRKYLAEGVLGITNGKLEKSWNVDLFVNACVLYAKKYGEECIDIIDLLIEDEERWEIFTKYVRSFEWRDTAGITGEEFIELLKKYPCGTDDLWSMLIGNSVKVSNPFNADFLHKFLMHYELNRRDHFWTEYINKLTWDESDRVVQLIQMFERGEKLVFKSDKQVELLLTLFGWLLTSSNRWLRDYTSKAMVEILKDYFDLCEHMLEKFKDVNDPYVLQRLYGVVFGACCKRSTGSLQNLAEYIYETIFNQKNVFPDVLLRDYARLIIEKYLSEEPDYGGVIDRQKIIPPYNSEPIPEIEDQHYESNKYEGAMLRLIMSMRIEKMGGYGDFGRYVFQSALCNFDVNMNCMFNYAVYHIINDLGFSNELFEEHDCHIRSFDRYDTAKTERIGKKYQWITLYNMLARVSDNCKMIDRWSYPKRDTVQFEGAWDPYVRDFDPTLNKNFMKYDAAPFFDVLKTHIEHGTAENKGSDISTQVKQDAWLANEGIFFKELKSTLIMTDDNAEQWVCLTKYCDTGRKELNVEKLLVWSWLYAYFMTQEQAQEIAACAEKGLSIITHDTASHNQTYTIFNREYPWSPSCKDLEEYAWINAEIGTGEYESVTETVQIPGFSILDEILSKYQNGDTEVATIDSRAKADPVMSSQKDTEDKLPQVSFQEEIRIREVEQYKTIGKILHSTMDLLWEEEYDATKESAISHSLPCGKLLEVMELKQLEADGFFFDSTGRLAAFDTEITQGINSVVVRKDILDQFLQKTEMKLVWLVDAEKEIHSSDYTISNWSDWEAVFIYDDDTIRGNIHRIEGKRR